MQLSRKWTNFLAPFDDCNHRCKTVALYNYYSPMLMFQTSEWQSNFHTSPNQKKSWGLLIFLCGFLKKIILGKHIRGLGRRRDWLIYVKVLVGAWGRLIRFFFLFLRFCASVYCSFHAWRMTIVVSVSLFFLCFLFSSPFN